MDPLQSTVFSWILLQAIFHPSGGFNYEVTNYLADDPVYYESEKACEESQTAQFLKLHESPWILWKCFEITVPLADR